MIKHLWSLLTKESVINQEDNSLHIGALLESITIAVPKQEISNLKGVPLEFEVLSYLTKTDKKSEEKVDIMISLYDPENKKLQELKHTVIIPIGKDKMRSRAKIQGLPVTKKGYYIFKVGMKKPNEKTFKTVAKIPLEVDIKTEQFPIIQQKR